MGYHWSPIFLLVPTVRDKGSHLDSTEFGKNALKERGLQEDPKPDSERTVRIKPTSRLFFFQRVLRTTAKPAKAEADIVKETAEADKKQAEKTKVYQEYKEKAKDISLTYLLAYSSLGGKRKKNYDRAVRAANSKRIAAGKPTKKERCTSGSNPLLISEA